MGMYGNNTFLKNNNDDEMTKTIYSNKHKNNTLAQIKTALILM
jgi:hypothetical protein